jgi:hypothetical protein
LLQYRFYVTEWYGRRKQEGTEALDRCWSMNASHSVGILPEAYVCLIP